MWVKSASAYAKKQKAKECKDLITNQIKVEEEITKKNIENHLLRQSERNSRFEEKKPSVVENSKKREILAEDSLDIFYAPPKQETISSMINKNDLKEVNQGVFDSILESSLNNPKTELSFKPSPSIKKDSAFLNYINARKVERKIDYLLLTAYYFTQYEQKPRFTLKQLNAKLMQNIAVIIDHSVLQEAINRDYIECLPDLIGLVGASEYRLTAYGEKVLLDE